MRKPSLGRGLSQLISGNNLAQTRAVIEISVERLEPNPFQPRGEFREDSLTELAESIRTQGIVQPLVVRPMGENYEIVVGERRWRAAQQLGLETVPCVVQEISNQEALELALIENLQREDLTCIEAARAYEQLIEEFSLTQEELAERIGKSRPAVANTLRLLQLPEEIQLSIQKGEMSEGHGRALLSVGDDPGVLMGIWRRVVEEGLSVRETEALVGQTKEGAGRKRKRMGGEVEEKVDPHIIAAAERLQETLAARVSIRPGRGGGGTIVIQYHNGEELGRLLELIAPEEVI